MLGAQGVNRRTLVGRVAVHVVNLQFCRPRVDDRAVLARDDRDSYSRLAHAGETHAVAGVELLQHFSVRTVVHAGVRQHAVDVNTQQADSTRSIRHRHGSAL